ncbi:MAG TPA: hypothetical protein VMI54_19400 [Polyangiaceae bacterium]|nr:hypothetical protein [Polyangiaceae bacterium]
MALVQRWTAAVSMGLVVGALLACKKKPDATDATASATASAPGVPAASASASSSAAASASAAPTAVAPLVEAKLGDVKRYGVEKESRLDDAGVRVAADGLKVYDEADTTKDDVATLPKDLLVFRQVKMGDFTLVEFPSGVGQFSQGWVETKGLSTTVEKVTRAGALDEKKTATVTTKDGGAPSAADAGAKKPEPPPTPEPKKTADKKPAKPTPPKPPKTK